jgi:hypothetical protein
VIPKVSSWNENDHAHMGIVGQGPGLRDVKPLWNAQYFAGIDIQRFLYRILDALELGLFEDIEIFRDQVLRVVDHFQALDELDLLRADAAGNARPEEWLNKQWNDFVGNHRHYIRASTQCPLAGAYVLDDSMRSISKNRTSAPGPSHHALGETLKMCVILSICKL